MNEKMPLFNHVGPYRGMPPHNGSETSSEAAEYMVDHGWESLQFRVLQIMGKHPAGMCDWQLRPYFDDVKDLYAGSNLVVSVFTYIMAVSCESYVTFLYVFWEDLKTFPIKTYKKP